MYWADDFAQQIIKSGKHQPYWADDMKTPSGRIHVGSLRGIISHDLIYKALLDAGKSATLSYVIENQDPMDGLPIYLDKKKYQQYMGQPLWSIPSPKSGYKSYADYFAQDFIEIVNALGAKPKIIYGLDLYRSGKMNQGIKQVLDAASKIRQLYKKISGSAKPADWYPLQVICPKCGKIGTTKVTGWDGEKVSFKCLPALVKWAQGCGHEGKISPFNGNGKVPWKIEWALKWQAVGITIEGAGKDHMTEGGSHDIASAICRQVINYPVPFHFSHEFLLIGGRKMSSSRGLGSSAREMYNLLPPAILRFLLVRPRYNRAIDFDPGSYTIPDLFDTYDHCAVEFYRYGRKSDLGRIFELSQVKKPPPKKTFYPRFREVAQYLQMPKVNLTQHFETEKGKSLTITEKKILAERVHYAEIWLRDHAPKEEVFSVSQTLSQAVAELNQKQKDYLLKVAQLLAKDWSKPEEFQQALYDASKSLDLPAQKAFTAIYIVLLGKTHGPKAAWLLLDQDRKAMIQRLKKVAGGKKFDVLAETRALRKELSRLNPNFDSVKALREVRKEI
ncbi:lysine--tRNA ligase [Patescibacteria group bacterium]|nr:lysine--tRNA ligase [Patescibacteria group bacterium]MBU1931484.1 lysine--tRNA ligase [Patescibacteria group bacterium]